MKAFKLLLIILSVCTLNHAVLAAEIKTKETIINGDQATAMINALTNSDMAIERCGVSCNYEVSDIKCSRLTANGKHMCSFIDGTNQLITHTNESSTKVMFETLYKISKNSLFELYFSTTAKKISCINNYGTVPQCTITTTSAR